MESRIRTGSGFRAQGAVKRKTSNGNPDTMEWFRLEGSGSGNFARERIGDVATVGAHENNPGNREIGNAYKPPLQPSSSTFAFCFLVVVLSICFMLRK